MRLEEKSQSQLTSTAPTPSLLALSHGTWILPIITLGGATGSGRRPRSFIASEALF